MIILELPYPPSVNHYYRHVGPRVLISREGRNYRDVVAARIKDADVPKFDGDVELKIQLYPPDNRRRDIDNVLKCLLDSLTFAEIYDDDSQVKRLFVEKLEPLRPAGLAVLLVRNYEKSTQSRQNQTCQACS